MNSYYEGGLNTNGAIVSVHIEFKSSCFRI